MHRKFPLYQSYKYLQVPNVHFNLNFKKSRGIIVERFRSIKTNKSFISSQACEFTNIPVPVVRAPVGRYAVIYTWGSY